MRAWRVHELGEPGDVMVLDDIEAPVADPGEVLLDVAAASLNFPDVLMCRGKYQEKPRIPFIVGGEVAGTVAGLGEGVTGFEVGQRVLALTRTGGLCDQAIADAAVTFPIPDSLELAPAAALHIVYQTGTSACIGAPGCEPRRRSSCTPVPVGSDPRRSSSVSRPAHASSRRQAAPRRSRCAASSARRS